MDEMYASTRDEPEVQRALGAPRKRRRNPFEDPLVDEDSIEELAVQLAADVPLNDLGDRALFGSRPR